MKNCRQTLFILWMAALGTLALQPAAAQYYYNDLVANRQAAGQYLLLKQSGVQRVWAVSFESDNRPTDNFKLEQQVSPGAGKIVTQSSSDASGNSYSVSYFENGRIVKNEDSSNQVFTTTEYTYNAEGRISNIRSTTRDAFMGSIVTEDHQWFYNEKGLPTLMLKIKDKTDTTRVELLTDEQGQIGEEVWKRKGRITERYYYYYNTKGQLTDIVRFNNRARRMLPDFLFEYDEQGRLVQMTQVPANSSQYLVWKYQYNERGLKAREVCIDKQQQLLGRIEYNYQ